MTVLIGLFLAVGAGVLAVLWWQSYIRELGMERVPAGLDVIEIVYENEEARGFGPGGNESGLVVYRMTGESAEQARQVIAEEECRFAPRNENRSYGEWRRTPVDLGEAENHRHFVPNPDDEQDEGTIRIERFLGRYGTFLDLDPAVVRIADWVLTTSGSCYAYGRDSITIVAPGERIVIFAYAG